MSEADDVLHLAPEELEILGPLIKALADVAYNQLKAEQTATNASATLPD